MKAECHDPFAKALLHRLPESPRKVALLRASRIGDFVCAGPAFHALRTALPNAQITIITLPMLRDIAIRSPDFDRFEAFRGFPGIAEQLFDARETARFLRRMQAERFDLAVQMQGSGVYSRLLAEAQRPLIGLHFAARDATRRWPVENFLAAGRAVRRCCGGTLVIIGGPEEVLQAERLKSLAGPSCLNLAGSTPLATLGAVIARLAVFITTDSGPAHIAYALKTPTVTVFGGGDPLRYGPPVAGPFRALVHPVPCRPCTDPVCPIDYQCLAGISVEEAVAAAEQVMAQSTSQSLLQSPPPSLSGASRERVRLSVS